MNSIVCGTFHTDSLHVSLPTPEIQERAGGRTSACAGSPTPDEIVGTALYLASDASSYLNGDLLVLNGG